MLQTFYTILDPRDDSDLNMGHNILLKYSNLKYYWDFFYVSDFPLMYVNNKEKCLYLG